MTNDATSAPKDFSVDRIGTRTYTARNDKGGELIIGNGPGQFTPGDLLKLAVLGCTVLSSDARFARALGDDFEMSGTVSARHSDTDERFTDFLVELFPNLDMLDEEEQAKLKQRATGAISRYCTISRTLDASAQTSLEINGEQQ